VARDKVNLDICWLKDDALDDPDLLPPPEEVVAEIVENLETALERFRGSERVGTWVAGNSRSGSAEGATRRRRPWERRITLRY
jgi:hypothetical protein